MQLNKILKHGIFSMSKSWNQNQICSQKIETNAVVLYYKVFKNQKMGKKKTTRIIGI